MRRFYLALTIFSLLPQLAFSTASTASIKSDPLTVTRVRVVDGNTLQLSDGRTVRLIGVDCPEFKDQERNKKTAESLGIDPEHYSGYAEKAKAFVNMLVAGQQVRLEYDEANTATDNKDKYGRVLAYVVIKQGLDAPYIYDKAKIPTDDLLEGGGGPGILVAWGRGEEVEEKFGYLLNGMIVRSGHGLVDRQFYFKYKPGFLELEQEAKKARRGLWG